MIRDQKKWDEWVESNKDSYGKCCVDVAREVMRILDEKYEGKKKKITRKDTHKLICQADDNIKAGGITGYMAGAVSCMVAACHSMGDEWRKAWNNEVQIDDEGEEATKEGTTLNPAIITIKTK